MWNLSISTYMASNDCRIYVNELFIFICRKPELALNRFKTTLQDITFIFSAFDNDLLRNHEENRHFNQAYKNQFIGQPFAKRAPIDTVSGLLDTLSYLSKIYRGGF